MLESYVLYDMIDKENIYFWFFVFCARIVFLVCLFVVVFSCMWYRSMILVIVALGMLMLALLVSSVHLLQKRNSARNASVQMQPVPVTVTASG